MTKGALAKLAEDVWKSTKKHSPEILTAIGIASGFTAVVTAIQATPKALELVEEKKIEKYQNGEPEKLTPVETVKTVWKCYIPTMVFGGLSVACHVCATSANHRRHAALATAYTLSEAALKEYQEKVVEEVGEKKEQTIRDAIAKDRVDKKPVSKSEVIITEKGNTLCFDVLSGRYFKSDIDKLRKAENDLNRRMRDEMYISLNEFYYEIGLDGVKMGDDLGWNIDSGYIDLDFRSQLADDGTPCLVVDYHLAPRYEFQ